MKPVNLLPEESRPARASGSLAGSAYAVVGVLVVALALVSVYVLTANKASSERTAAADARQRAAAASARAAELGPFANFAQIKQTRVASVNGLAQARFDWERFVRETARVLPSGTWLTDVDASATAPAADGAAAPAPGTAPTGPTAKLGGCAKDQPDVAKLMVRLRKMHRVQDVSLNESSKDGSSSGGSSTGSSSASESGGCGRYFTFDLDVSFDSAPAQQAPARVPVALGGGQ